MADLRSTPRRVMAVLVVLAQQILAVVVAVGRAHDHMNMIFIGLGVFAERDAALVIELDDDHRTLDAIVKCTVVRHAAHPAEISVFEMLLHFFHFHLGMAVAHTRDVVVDEIEQKIMLRFRQIIVADAGVIQLPNYRGRPW